MFELTSHIPPYFGNRFTNSGGLISISTIVLYFTLKYTPLAKHSYFHKRHPGNKRLFRECYFS